MSMESGSSSMDFFLPPKPRVVAEHKRGRSKKQDEEGGHLCMHTAIFDSALVLTEN